MRRKMNVIATCFAIVALPGVALLVACGAPPDGQGAAEDTASAADTSAHDATEVDVGARGRVADRFVYVCEPCNEDQTGPNTSNTVPGSPPPPPPIPIIDPVAPVVAGLAGAGR